MSVRAAIWTGGDPTSRAAKLTVTKYYSDVFTAYWEPGYCGCPDCHPIVGAGETEDEAIADYWEQWEGKHGSAN